jgi:uncharacterized protein (DUF4415 family)
MRGQYSTARLSSVDRIAMVKSGIKSLGVSMGAKSRSSARSVAKSAGSSRRGGPAGPSGGIITPISRDDPRRGKTDWAALDALTDEEIEASIANDPDWSEDFDWTKAVLVIPPKKKAISIRVDEDVLDYFKHQGSGYQRRINAVLRSYVEQKRKAPARKKRRA